MVKNCRISIHSGHPYRIALKSENLQITSKCFMKVWSLKYKSCRKMEDHVQLQLHHAWPVSDLQAWWSPAWSKEAMSRSKLNFIFWVFGNIWELGNYLQIGGSFLNHKVKATILSATTEFPQPKVSTGQGKTTTKGLAGTYQGQWNVVAPAQKKKATKYCSSASFPLSTPMLSEFLDQFKDLRCSKPEGMK